MRFCWYLSGLAAIVAALSCAAAAEGAVFAQLSADGHVKFETAEDVLINDSRKIKLAPEAAARLDPIEAKSLPHAEAGQAGLLRGDGKGRVYRVNPDGSTDRVIPENFALKMSIQAATTPIPLTITLVRNKKDKNASDVPAEQFYLYVAAADAERAALSFVLNARNFGGTAEQLRVIEGFGRSFQSAPVAADLRHALSRQLAGAHEQYDLGGTFEALLETQKVAVMAQQLFESDADLARAAGDINDRIQTTQTTARMLVALADAEDWGTFRTVYRKIEMNQDSFPKLRALRKRALEEETREYCERARTLILRRDDGAALKELAAAALLDPENSEISKLAESTRALAAERTPKETKVVAGSAGREEGDAARSQVISGLRKREQESKAGIDSSLKEGDYQQAYKQSVAALKFEPNSIDFLYSAGLSAAVSGKPSEAKGYLDAYLQYSDNLASSDARRSQARKLARVAVEKPAVESKTGSPNWLSGRPLSSNVYYCPASLAFQPAIESVSGFKFHANYIWADGRLRSIRTKFEDEKGKQDYLQIAAKSTWPREESQLGKFFFLYQQDRATVQSVYAGAAPAGLAGGETKLVKNEDKSYKLVDGNGNPLVVLENNPWIDLKVVGELMGPAATIVAGNSFFNPFIWDGLHYFTVSYDEQGRAVAAKEWNANNTVHFHWDGERLTEIEAFHTGEGEAYYRREITYAGPNINSEEYKSGGRGGRIKYAYSKDGALISAKMDDNGVHDGKTWTVRMAEHK